MNIKKVFLTADNTILIVTASTDGTSLNNRYVSVTADEIAPLSYEDAKERSRESLEDGELWKMAVQAGHTEQGLSDWIERVLSIDGEVSQVDNSLYPERVSIDGEDYIFDSLSCGCLHDEIKLLTDKFDTLIALHLSHSKDAIAQAEKIMHDIKSDNVDARVRQLTKKILQAA
jgi:hypothetical protein